MKITASSAIVPIEPISLQAISSDGIRPFKVGRHTTAGSLEHRTAQRSGIVSDVLAISTG
jgi:hypothetical protein